MKTDLYQHRTDDFWSCVDSSKSPVRVYACTCPEAPSTHLGDCGTNGPGWMDVRAGRCMAMRSDRTRCKSDPDGDSPFCELHMQKVARWVSWAHPSVFMGLLNEAEENYARRIIRSAQVVDLNAEVDAIKSRVYFLGLGDQIVKIGRSIRPESRMMQVRQGSGLIPAGYDRKQIELLGSVPGGSELESRLHRLLRPHRLHGEWFAQHRDVIAVMAYMLGGEMERDARPVFLDELTRPWWINEGLSGTSEEMAVPA